MPRKRWTTGRIIVLASVAVLLASASAVIYVRAFVGGHGSPDRSTGTRTADSPPPLSSSPNNKDDDGSGAPDPTKSQNQKHMTIAEWGVKMPLSGDIEDAYYVPRKEANPPQVMLWLGIESLDSVGHCDASKAGGTTRPLASIFRTSPDSTDPVDGKNYQDKYPNGVVIDGYYYAYNDNWIKNFPCAEDSSYDARLDRINTAFAEAAKNIIKAD